MVHVGHSVTLEGADETLGYAIALLAADGRVDGFHAYGVCQSPRVNSDVCSAIKQYLPNLDISRRMLAGMQFLQQAVETFMRPDNLRN